MTLYATYGMSKSPYFFEQYSANSAKVHSLFEILARETTQSTDLISSICFFSLLFTSQGKKMSNVFLAILLNDPLQNNQNRWHQWHNIRLVFSKTLKSKFSLKLHFYTPQHCISRWLKSTLRHMFFWELQPDVKCSVGAAAFYSTKPH